MFLKHIDLTTALRPSYLQDEVLLFVQDNVGLYQGKFKLPDQQDGQVYLTSHRICYVDKTEPRLNSLALDLKEIDRYEFYAGFLKSSPKITIIPRPSKRPSLHRTAVSAAAATSDRNDTTPRLSPSHRDRGPSSEQRAIITTATWVCSICTFSNPVPDHFDPAAANAHTPLPSCLACGIKPTLSLILKAAISNAVGRDTLADGYRNSSPSSLADISSPASETPSPVLLPGDRTNANETNDEPGPIGGLACPRCTFKNHPSLLLCEMCGATLPTQRSSLSASYTDLSNVERSQSPGPYLMQTSKIGVGGLEVTDNMRISFRGGGREVFHERLKGAMTQRKWLLQHAPPPPKIGGVSTDSGANSTATGSSQPKSKAAGIAGLEQLRLDKSKDSELLIGSAFEDLEALMSSAKEIIALAERLARENSGPNGSASDEDSAILAESAHQLGLVTTKDIVGGSSSERLYFSELARHMAEFLTDDARGVLKKKGGIITLVDLWAMFNRARGGVELVSPSDFEKAARQWESLKLPVRLRTFRSGVMVVQGRYRTDESTIRTLLSWLQDLHEFPPENEVLWDWREFGRGVTAQEAAEQFGWSLGVAEEELLMAEEHGAVCREQNIEGLKFWQNYILGDSPSMTGDYRSQDS